MTLDPLTLALLSAIGALATACGALYRRVEALHKTLTDDRQKASALIFALLQQRRDERGERAPPTVTEWSDEPTTQVTDRAFVEAQAHGTREVNGDLESLCKRYLAGDSTPPTPRRVDVETRKVSSDLIAEAERRLAEKRKP